jgi:GT2 family glycosyltransferase
MVSVIVITYHSEKSIEQCLVSVRNQAADILVVEIIVVDNCSQDKTCDIIQSKFGDVTLLKNDENTGFGAACNQAIHKSRGEFILLLNPDAVLEPECLTKLIAFMKQNEKCAASGPSLRAADGAFQPSAFNFPTFSWVVFHLLRFSEWVPGRTFLRRQIESSSKQSAQQMPSIVDWVTGACMMLRREAVNDVGMLDENFFLFFEEIEAG